MDITPFFLRVTNHDVIKTQQIWNTAKYNSKVKKEKAQLKYIKT